MIKAPVWKPEVPFYFFAGGHGRRLGRAGVRRATQRATASWRAGRGSYALAGVAVSPPLLISDLGRPERFLNMLRVFKVTSPMSVGSWILAFDGHRDRRRRRHRGTGLFPRRAAAEGAAGVLGLPLATYTAVLHRQHRGARVARGPPGAAVPVRRRGGGNGGCGG